MLQYDGMKESLTAWGVDWKKCVMRMGWVTVLNEWLMHDWVDVPPDELSD